MQKFEKIIKGFLIFVFVGTLVFRWSVDGVIGILTLLDAIINTLLWGIVCGIIWGIVKLIIRFTKKTEKK